MSIWVKICGLTHREAVEAAVEAGADAIGFVFAPSVRRVEPAAAVRLCEGVPGGVTRVAVMRHPTPDEWRAVERGFGPDWLQTDAEDLAELRVPQGCGLLPVFRDDSRGFAADSPNLPSRLLFEGAQSGSGQRADWTAAARLARRARLVLAGGLSPDNVVQALDAVRPWGVDVSSGVEEMPGRKDPARIAAFVENVRRWERSRPAIGVEAT